MSEKMNMAGLLGGMFFLVLIFIAPVEAMMDGRYVSRTKDVARDVATTADGQYVVLGQGQNNLFLMKYDQRLKRRWIKRQMYRGKVVKNAMVVVLGGRCVVLVTMGDQTQLLLYDLTDGRLIRQEKIKGLGKNVIIQDAVVNSDNTVLVGGTLSLSQKQGTDLVLMIVKVSGEIIQTHDYEMNGNETLSHMQRTRDGGVVLVGNITRNQLIDLLVMKVKEDLSQEWSHRFDARLPLSSLALNDLNAGQSITQCTDGGYVVAGTAAYFDNQLQAICMKLDSKGNMVWRAPFTASDHSNIVSRFVSMLDNNHIMLIAEKRLPDNVTHICFAQLNDKGQQVDMVEQVKFGETSDWAAATRTRDHGLLYVKNSFMEKQKLRIVETEKIDDVSQFFSTEKDKSARALEAMRWSSPGSR